MGYTKIVQFGDTIEIYSYEKNIKPKQADALKAERLFQESKGNHGRARSNTLNAKRTRDIRLRSQAQGSYRRSDASIRRSKINFFRLCHENNCNAKTIHFITLTFSNDVTIKKANRDVQHFMERVAKNLGRPPRYISVAELTKKDRIHFHVLFYDLPPETAKNERVTRNFQRQWRRGYVDVRLASYTSKGIAGYMAKYMGKALGNPKLTTKRGYTSSRNIDKVRATGGNALSGYMDLIIPTDRIAKEETSSYDVPYLGVCQFKRIKIAKL